MTCERVTLPGGGTAIVCGRARKRCACGRPETRLCDWKMPGKKSGTCDRSLCGSCVSSPVPGKDLCPEHSEAFKRWQIAKLQAAPA